MTGDRQLHRAQCRRSGARGATSPPASNSPCSSRSEAIVEFCQSSGPITVEIGYDEFDIDVTMTYPGSPLELTGQLPTHDEILESEDGARRLAAFLIMQRSDRVKAAAQDGVATLALHFRH